MFLQEDFSCATEQLKKITGFFKSCCLVLVKKLNNMTQKMTKRS